MKFKYLAPLAALIPLITFAAVSVQPQPHATSQAFAQYDNTRWHFSVLVPDDWSANAYDAPAGQTIQFVDPVGNHQFQISAWPYQDLDVALGEEAPAGNVGDQPNELGIVHVFHIDMFEIAFVKNGISYVVQTLPENASSTLDILKSWQFI